LQQSSAFAEGMHLPFRQQSIASRVRALAKQSNGRASNTIASRLTTIWTPRLISIFQPTIKCEVWGVTFRADRPLLGECLRADAAHDHCRELPFRSGQSRWIGCFARIGPRVGDSCGSGDPCLTERLSSPISTRESTAAINPGWTVWRGLRIRLATRIQRPSSAHGPAHGKMKLPAN